MKRAVLLLLFVGVAAVVAMERIAKPEFGEHPVVVELFTSQGCSSCPPADALLGQIAHDARLRGKVIPLAFHVDYWNSLGWRDPFSSRAWSERQGSYVRALSLPSAFTPQMIINGTRSMVGSNTLGLYETIAAESKRADEGRITLTRKGSTVTVQATSPHRDAELFVVTFETAATTRVTAGENNGKTLADTAIVRTLARVESGGRVEVDPRLGVAAFLQDPATRRVWTAAAQTAALPARPE